MLLPYLVTSRVRRALLRLLWEAGAEGSVSALARRAGVSFAAAHRELQAMRAAGLARSSRAGKSLVYSANPGSPHAKILRELLDAAAAPTLPSAPGAEKVRTWLSVAGAPLLVSRPGGDRMPPLEEVVAEGLVLAHQDATVARVLPLVLWRHRGRLDHEELTRQASVRNERQALGFFLELTGRLGGDHRLSALARGLRDRRRKRARPFFGRSAGPRAVALARLRSPAVARRWGYLMNMDLESFASAFRRHGEAA